MNTGENKSRGIEFGYEHRWDAFDLSLDASWVQSRNVTGDFSYGAFPRWIVNAGIGWRSPSRKVSVRVTNRIHLDADAHPVNPLLPSPEELSDYFRTDVHVAWRLGERAWLRFDVRNLFDRDNHFPSVWAHEGGVPDERINASVGFRWSW